MKLLAQYEDPFWEDQAISHIRYTTRVLIENAQGELGFLKITGEDAFGPRDHYETCGGGVEEGETFIQAAMRELKEEMGVSAHHFTEVGVIIDRLNPLARLTVNVYFHALVDAWDLQMDRTESEALLIESIVWLSPVEAIRALSQAKSPIDAFVHRRDLRALNDFLINQNQGT